MKCPKCKCQLDNINSGVDGFIRVCQNPECDYERVVSEQAPKESRLSPCEREVADYNGDRPKYL